MHSRKVIWYDFDDFRLEVETLRLLKNDVSVNLSPKSLQTLLILVEHAGEIVEKDDIYRQLWADSFVEEGNLTQHIYMLRKNLGQEYIETVARHGYRFTAKVRTVHAEISVENTDEAQETAQKNEDELASQTGNSVLEKRAGSKNGFSNSNFFSNGKEPARPDLSKNNLQTGKSKLKNKKWLLAALLFVSLAGIFTYLYISGNTNKQAKTASARKIESIAILPFKTIGVENESEPLSLGMTDAIIIRLSKLKQIPVRPTSSVFRFVGTETTPVKAGRDLQVDAILEGTIQQNGRWVRVSVQLIKVDSGETIWAENFDGEYTHIFNVQDKISENIVSNLALNLSPEQTPNINKKTTDNIEAYRNYTLGIYFWNKRTKEGLLKAEQYFLKAIELDPNYAQAYAGLADSYNMLAFNRFTPLDKVGEKAKTAALKAVELDDTLAEAHLALAQVQFAYENNEEAGAESLERAIELAPYNATAHLRYGWQMLSDLRLNDAEREMRLAQEYDPLSPTHNLALCNILVCARKYDEAKKFCEQAIEIDRKVPGGRISLAEVYFLLGKNEQALGLAVEDVKENSDDLYLQTFLAYLYARNGNKKEAAEIAGKLNAETEKTPGLLMDAALLEYTIGRKNEALAFFKKALEKKSFSRKAIIYDPKYDEMKADESFSGLFEQYNLIRSIL